jgi:hypothetical protein
MNTVQQPGVMERLVVYVPPSLKRQVEATARANKRSTTKEAEIALERHVKDEGRA